MRLFSFLLACLVAVIRCQENSSTQCHFSSYNESKKIEYLADCSYLNLTDIPSDLPTNITCLNLLGNSLVRINEKPWQRYRLLRKLSLSRNNIEIIYKRDFNGLQKLEMLDLSLNHIKYTNIHYDAFKPLNSLLYLDIKQNLSNIWTNEHYPKDLEHLTQLQTLVIDGLGTQILPHLPNLTELYMSGEYGRCNITTISESLFENIKSVQNVFFSKCSVRSVGFNSFKSLQKIVSLDMSGNEYLGMESLPNITSGLDGKHTFKRLNLNTLYNHSEFDFCSSLSINDFKHLINTSVEMVTIENNNLVRMDIATAINLPKSIKYLSVQHNMFLFGNYTPFLIGALNEIVYLDISRMAAANRPVYTGTEVKKTTSYRAHTPEQCMENKSMSHYIDTQMFTRYQVGDYFQFIEKRLKCQGILNDTPQNHRSKLEYLDLSENLPVLIERIFEIFRFIPNLKVLNVSRNYLGYPLYDGPSILGQLEHLRTLDLSDNKIIGLHPDVFKNLKRLEHLYLSHNKISNITFDLSQMKKLKYIDLSNNNLEAINKASRDVLDNLSGIQINIVNNNLKCTCENIEFIKWVHKNPNKIANRWETTCKFENATVVSLSTFHYDNFFLKCSNFLTIILISSCALLFILLLITCAVIYRYRWNLRYLYYMTKLKLSANYQQLDETEYANEVFVSYADEDRDFVIDQVKLELEERGEISLLIHDRDFRAGEYVVDNILRAIASTRRTLIILTKSFLKSKWCMYELNMARMKASDTGRNVLCFLLKEDIPSRDLSLEILDALKKMTYIEYPSADDDLSQFWERLRSTLKLKT